MGMDRRAEGRHEFIQRQRIAVIHQLKPAQPTTALRAARQNTSRGAVPGDPNWRWVGDAEIAEKRGPKRPDTPGVRRKVTTSTRMAARIGRSWNTKKSSLSGRGWRSRIAAKDVNSSPAPSQSQAFRIFSSIVGGRTWVPSSREQEHSAGAEIEHEAYAGRRNLGQAIVEMQQLDEGLHQDLVEAEAQ